MNHLISTEEIDNLKALLLQAFNSVENEMIERQLTAKVLQYNYDNTKDQSTLKALRSKIVELDRLPIAFKTNFIKTEVSEIDIMQYKLWGFAECSYKQITGNKIDINSQQEYEAALQDINKELHLNESI